MEKIPVQICIEETLEKQASELFASLGLDFSDAVNLFLHQCVRCGGLPFPSEIPEYNRNTFTAMEEAKRISHDSCIKGYSSIDALKKALES